MRAFMKMKPPEYPESENSSKNREKERKKKFRSRDPSVEKICVSMLVSSVGNNVVIIQANSSFQKRNFEKNKVSVKELFYVNTKCYTKRYTFCISFMYQYNLCSCALSISSRN